MQKLSVPRGTQDVLPAAWRVRHRVLDAVRVIFERHGYQRIQTPTFEATELFARGVGESTDIVRKEMYTFRDNSDRSLTLRPEGTAPVVRAFVEHGMHRDPLPVKLWYFSPMFRYEKPQEGRYREHYQIGAEAIGSDSAAVDAELISMLDALYCELRVPEVTLHLNTIGDENCRPAYRALLVEFLESHRADLCDECKARINTNPLRAFDCKQEGCRVIMRDAPVQSDHLCAECAAHFTTVRDLLDAAGIAYTLDPSLVRGLDYYTRTTFEFKCARLGAQDGVGGGGRYDGLVETLGGAPTPGVGFGSGIERIVLAMQAGDVALDDEQVDYYVGSSETHGSEMFELARRLRAEHYVEYDLLNRSTSAQLKRAKKIGAVAFVVENGQLTRYSDQGRTATPTTFEDPLTTSGA